MMGIEEATTAGLVLVAAGGIWWDVREGRVPNALTGGALLLGLALGIWGGMETFVSALAGAGAGFAVALPVFLVGGLGGGDVKLLAAMGSLLGFGQLPAALAAIAVIGGLMAAFEVVRRGAVRRTARNIFLIIMSFGRDSFTRWKQREAGNAFTVGSPTAITVPYAVAIAVGSVAVHLL